MGKDLVMEFVDLAPTETRTSFPVGSTLIIMNATQNIGGVATPSGASAGIYLRNSVTGTDYFMGARSTKALSGYGDDASMSGYVAGVLNVPVGSYYLKGCADYTNVIQEVNEDNNSSSAN